MIKNGFLPFYACFCLISGFGNQVFGSDKFPLDTDLGGISTYYTNFLKKLVQPESWPPKGLKDLRQNTDPVRIECLSTPGQEFYVGVAQSMTIQAPLSRIAQVLEDYPHYTSM